MGRQLPKDLSPVGWRIYGRMRQLKIEPAEVAAAAGLSPSTLYRLMRADRSATSEPRLRTKRKLAKALKLPMAKLFDEPQFELLDEVTPPPTQGLDSLEKLILHHFRTLDLSIRKDASRAASFALVDIILTLAGEVAAEQVEGPSTSGGEDGFEALLLGLFRRLPLKVRRHGARAAISAMLNVQMVSNTERSEPLYRSISRTNWSDKRLTRDRPPLNRLPPANTFNM